MVNLGTPCLVQVMSMERTISTIVLSLVPWGNLLAQGRTKPVDVKPAEVRDILYRDIFEKKLRQAMAERFEKMQADARIENYLAGTSQSPKGRQSAQRGTAPRRDAAVRAAGATNGRRR